MQKYALLVACLLLPFSSQASLNPQDLVKTTTHAVQQEIKQDRTGLLQDPARLYALIDRLMLPHVDFNHMARWTLGKHWRHANNEQRDRFTSEFRTLLMHTYANALLELVDSEIVYQPTRISADRKEVTVRTVIKRQNALPVPVHYTLHEKNGVWKAYDITIDGISLINNYRSSFAREMRQGDLNRLINMLAERNQATPRN
jgi:phospholipid transport system substrate-binding protein